ncbi:MAG TPA: dihydrodipicolinate reductase C-terminal domain-containing protein, partial [Bacteroidales bacterium]|nr:dihydrodipicolinate reductase C-terminal domain-containing protein [Bacteroidales bacterium]
SIGVNILFKFNRELAALMERMDEYRVELSEVHHTAKKDAPSGTAISLANDIINECSRYKSWYKDEHHDENGIGINCLREGNVTGTHTVKWQSFIDTISIKHEAHNRKGFALGAIFAAEYVHKRKGVFTMSDVLGF